MSRQLDSFKELYLDLLDDCRYYDMGTVRKAKDIAGRLRTLLKDGPHPKTVSLLTQLNLKEINFFDSTIPYTNQPSMSYFNIKTSTIKEFKIVDEGSTNFENENQRALFACSSVFMGLVGKKCIEQQKKLKFTFIPLFASGLNIPELREIDFATWWEKTIIYESPDGTIMTRKNLVLSIAEQDGFAHYDEVPNESYAKFSESDSLKLNVNGTFVKFTNSPAKASVRQIGHEVLRMIEVKLKSYI